MFDAVMDAHLEEIIGAVPIDATDLPRYVGRLFTYMVQHPELSRLLTWAGLERRLGPTAHAHSATSYSHRLAAIEAAQQTAQVPADFTPPQLLLLIESIAVGWTYTTTATFLSIDEDDPGQHLEAHRQVVVDSVRRLLT